MRIGAYVAFSIVASSLLVGTDYTNWGNASFQGGDKVTIDSKSKEPQVLNKSLTLNSGTLTVNVDASVIKENCGIVGCFSQSNSSTIGSQGSTINITLRGSPNQWDAGAFEVRGESSLIINSNLSIDTTRSGVSDAFQVADSTLKFEGDVSIKAQQAINAGKSKVELGQSGKKIDIQGELKFTHSSDVKIKLGNNSKIQGNIHASGSSIKLELEKGGRIEGNFLGVIDNTTNTNNSLDLKIASGAEYRGNITNGGITNINNDGTIRGSVTASGDKFDYTSHGTLTGSLNTNAITNTIKLEKNAGIIQGVVNTSGQRTTIIGAGTSKIQGGVESTSDKLEVTLTESAEINRGINASGTDVDIKLKDNSKLNGNSSFASTTSKVSLESSAQVNGNLTFNGNNNTLTAKENSTINGGINTGNGESKITFEQNAILQGGTSNLNDKTEILFKNNTKVKRENFNIQSGESNITFANSAQMEGGSINVNGGKGNVIFQDNSKMINGTVRVNGGELKLDAKNQANLSGNITQTSGKSEINFANASKMSGGIEVTDGRTNITFTGTSQMIGDIKAMGQNNNVTFTDGTKLDGNLTLDGLGHIDGQSQGILTGTHITGNIQGYDEVDLLIKETKVDGGLKQGGSFSNRAMRAAIIKSHIKGGFTGDGSNNILRVENSRIDNGIKQTGGSLDFKAMNSVFSGGFTGTNSDNMLDIANSNFSNGDIKQTGGSLTSGLINVKNLKDFIGKDSRNVIHLTNTKIKNVTQNGGGLELSTNSDVEGEIKGIHSDNKISIMGGNVAGQVSQTGGSMDLELFNANLRESITASSARLKLAGNNVRIVKGINLIFSETSGAMNNLELQGKFTQTGGTSTLTFSNTTFLDETFIRNAVNANLIFTKSTIRDVKATNGTSNLNLTDSQMDRFIGQNGDHSLTLVKSTSGSVTQMGGSLSINAASLSRIDNIVGRSATISASLSRSEVMGNVQNNAGDTTLNLQNSLIRGFVIQTMGSMIFTAENSSLDGQYVQFEGTANLNFTKSLIKQGMILGELVTGSLNFTQKSKVDRGIQATNSNFNFSILDESVVNGGFTQMGGNITGTLNGRAQINHGLDLRNGETHITLYNKSKISGGIKASNQTTKILVDDSEIKGEILVVGGKLFDLTAQNHSTIDSKKMSVTNTDLKLTIDTSSKFIGDFTQNSNKQDIHIKQNSTFQGSITNNNTQSNIKIENNAVLGGNLIQTNGSLHFDLSNKGIVTGNIILNDVDTTLSGSGMENEIRGNFSQNRGSLTGSMNGLTLQGIYSQDGGTSDVLFKDSHFQEDTLIINATSSSLTFNNSTLKNYTISGGNNNTLKLLNNSNLVGDLMLKNQAKGFLKMENSKITGNIQGSDDSTLRLNATNSTITGKISFDAGGITGITNNTTISGDIILKDTKSDISFTQNSEIGGNITATGGENRIQFNDSQIKGNISISEFGKIDLDLSNGSKVGGNVTFTDAIAHLTGKPAGNVIAGNFTTQGMTSRSISQLTGDISSLTLNGTFTQNFGTSDITFRDNSLFKGQVHLKEANFSKLNFLGNSGIENEVSIVGGHNLINLEDRSFIEGNTRTENQSTTTIQAKDSSITGNITANNARQTSLLLTSSTLIGNITQTKGSFALSAEQNSLIRSKLDFKEGVEAKLTLKSQSALEGEIIAEDSDLVVTLQDSRLNSIEAPQAINLENTPLFVNATHSIFGANLKSENTKQETLLHTLQFTNQSTYSGTMELKNIKTTASFEQSSIFSQNIKVDGGSFDLTFNNSPQGGLIENLEITNTPTNIRAQNGSKVEILKAQIKDNIFELLADNHSRLTIGDLTLQGTTEATYTAQTNGNLNVNTKIADDTSTLKVNIEGGILQGTITQDNLKVGSVTLQRVGDFGGRWIVTGDSQTKSLELRNDVDIINEYTIFKGALDTPLTLVDFTLNFKDAQTSSRMRQEIIAKPNPDENGLIPEPMPHQTYVRQLHLGNLGGNNGFFRVYADLGTNLADNVLADFASGDHIIQVYYRADTFREIGEDRIVVAKVTDPNTQVSFKGTQSDVGLTRYDTEIIKENSADGQGFEWIIGQATPAGISYSSKIIAAILQSQYRTFAIEIDSLDRRLGGLEKIERDRGFWVRAFFGQATKDATEYSTSANDQYYSIWSGFDYNAIGLTGHNFLGVFFSYTGMNTESKDYLGKSANFAFGVYDVFKAYSGFYFDVLAKYIYTTSEFEISNYSLDKNKPEINNHKLLANFEMGYTFYLGEKRKSLYIQPQFQITSGFIQGFSTEFIDVVGEKISTSVGHNAPVIMRGGVFVGQAFGEKFRANLKAGTSLVYDLNSGGELNFADSKNTIKRSQKGDIRLLLSAHTDLKFSDNFRMYTSFDTSFFGSYNTTFNVNLGLRFVFGRRNNIVSEVPMVYNPYTPIEPISDDTRTVPVIRNFTTQDINTNYKGRRRDVSTYVRGNPRPTQNYASPIQGYAPQPINRRGYRDATSEMNNPYGGNR